MLETLSATEITTTLIAICLLLAGAFICGKLFEWLKAPKVVGEIVGGMLFGGSGLGLLCPEFTQSIFNGYAAEGKVLNIFYQLGLILLMFCSGYTTSIQISKKNIKTYGLLFVGATIVPMLITIPFIHLFQKDFIGTANNNTAFAIVILIASAITSIPVISKIFFDIDMMGSKYANMVLTVSTIQDLCLWVLLNLAISLAQTQTFNVKNFILTATTTVGLLVIAKLITMIIEKKKWHIKKNIIPVCLLSLFGIVFVLSWLNINIMYSAFIAGYICKSMVGEENHEIDKMKDFSFAFFVPVYFALVGIQLDVIHNFSILRFLLFFLIIFGAEFIGTVGVMWVSKLKRKTVFSLGITMNARGGPGIVLATTAFAYNIINIEFFTVLIITIMLSSMIAGYVLQSIKQDIQNDG